MFRISLPLFFLGISDSGEFPAEIVGNSPMGCSVQQPLLPRKLPEFIDILGALHASEILSRIITQGEKFDQDHVLLGVRGDGHRNPEPGLVPGPRFHLADNLLDFGQAFPRMTFTEVDAD